MCGDPVYVFRPDGTRYVEDVAAPRLALHAAELGFTHPVNGDRLSWEMPLPAVLDNWLNTLRGA